MNAKDTSRKIVGAVLGDRGGQNITEFVVIVVFCFGLGAATFGLFGTRSTGLSTASPGECIDEASIPAGPRTFDAALLSNPAMSAPGVVDPACVSKGNLPARVANVYGARSRYSVLPIP